MHLKNEDGTRSIPTSHTPLLQPSCAAPPPPAAVSSTAAAPPVVAAALAVPTDAVGVAPVCVSSVCVCQLCQCAYMCACMGVFVSACIRMCARLSSCLIILSSPPVAACAAPCIAVAPAAAASAFLAAVAATVVAVLLVAAAAEAGLASAAPVAPVGSVLVLEQARVGKSFGPIGLAPGCLTSILMRAGLFGQSGVRQSCQLQAQEEREQGCVGLCQGQYQGH